MYAKKRPLWRVLLLIAAVALICALIGSAVGKYIYTETLSASVTFSAEMAKNVVLQENEANRLPDGSYELTESFVKNNTYTLIPGLDVPKNPHIIITEKSPVEAYLFVEVVENLPDTVTYSMASGWEELAVSGKHGGKVYVYNDVLDENTTADPIYILKDNLIYVSQDLLGSTEGEVMTFYACLGETAAGLDAEEVYNNTFN